MKLEYAQRQRRPDVLFCFRAKICLCTNGQSLATTVREYSLSVQEANLFEDTSREKCRSAYCRSSVGSVSADHSVMPDYRARVE